MRTNKIFSLFLLGSVFSFFSMAGGLEYEKPTDSTETENVLEGDIAHLSSNIDKNNTDKLQHYLDVKLKLFKNIKRASVKDNKYIDEFKNTLNIINQKKDNDIKQKIDDTINDAQSYLKKHEFINKKVSSITGIETKQSSIIKFLAEEAIGEINNEIKFEDNQELNEAAKDAIYKLKIHLRNNEYTVKNDNLYSHKDNNILNNANISRLYSNIFYFNKNLLEKCFFSDLAFGKKYSDTDLQSDLAEKKFSSLYQPLSLVLYEKFQVLREHISNVEFTTKGSSKVLNDNHGKDLFKDFFDFVKKTYESIDKSIRKKEKYNNEFKFNFIVEQLNTFVPKILSSKEATISEVINFAKTFRHTDDESNTDLFCEHVLHLLLVWLENNPEHATLKNISDIFYNMSQVYSHILEIEDYFSYMLNNRNGKIYVSIFNPKVERDILLDICLADFYERKLNCLRISLMLDQNNYQSSVRLLEYISFEVLDNNITAQERRLHAANKYCTSLIDESKCMIDYSLNSAQAYLLKLASNLEQTKFPPLKNKEDSYYSFIKKLRSDNNIYTELPEEQDNNNYDNLKSSNSTVTIKSHNNTSLGDMIGSKQNYKRRQPYDKNDGTRKKKKHDPSNHRRIIL